MSLSDPPAPPPLAGHEGSLVEAIAAARDSARTLAALAAEYAVRFEARARDRLAGALTAHDDALRELGAEVLEIVAQGFVPAFVPADASATQGAPSLPHEPGADPDRPPPAEASGVADPASGTDPPVILPDPTPEPAPPAEPPVPVTAALIRNLRSHINEPDWARNGFDTPMARQARETVRQALRALGPPPSLATDAADQDDVAAIETFCELQDDWPTVPPPEQVLLLTHLAARLRAIQERDAHGRMDARLKRAFNRLVKYSSRVRPGFVHGLSRNHGPKLDAWSDDAARAWDELAGPEEPPTSELALTRLDQHLDAARGDPAAIQRAFTAALDAMSVDDPRLLRRAATFEAHLRHSKAFKALRRELKKLSSGEEAATESTTPEPTWPHAHLLNGWRARIIGGDLREDARVRLRETLGVAELEWIRTEGGARGTQSLCDSLSNGGVELVITLLGFMSHSDSGRVIDAARDHHIPCARVPHGYGVEQVTQAVEHALFTARDAPFGQQAGAV